MMSKSIFSSQFWENQWRNDPNTSLKKMKRAGLGSYDSPGFEKWAINYDRQSFSKDGKARTERIIKWIEQQIPSFNHMTILDVGAASGVFSVPFAQRGASVTAVEPSPLLSELLIKNATTYDVDVNVMTAAFENKTATEIGHHDFVFASMCPAVTDWEAVQKALKIANKYVYVSLMAGPKENKLVDELIEQFNLQSVPTTADMYYLLQLLYVNNYTYQTLIERHTKTTDMTLTDVMNQLPTWFTDFDIAVSTAMLNDIQHYLQDKYGTTIPVTTGGKFGKVLIHAKEGDHHD
ncbi:class I SAM-dependent methyltransferase [Staphylococcus simiae]|nr:class I SAM-dependent methyltransferase [Staphylococcus simiae]